MESQFVGSTKTACELNRYVRQRSGRSSWWFRRRVPTALIETIGQDEWRFGLKSRSRDAAMAEAMPHYLHTEEVIALASKGDWPPLTLEEGQDMARQWALTPPLMTAERSVLDQPVFDSQPEFTASVAFYLAERAPTIRPGSTAYDCFVAHARSKALVGGMPAALDLRWAPEFKEILARVDARARGAGAPNLPKALSAKAVLLNDPYPSGGPDDLIGEWARRRKKPSKTEYQLRAMMRRLTEVTEVNDLTVLTRAQVEQWVDYLDKTLASNTVKANLDFLRILGNFAIERDYLTANNPAAKIKYIAKPGVKIRGYTDAEARVVLTWARSQTTPYLRWLPWVCCFTGCRLDEVAGAAVRDFEQVGRYWVFSVRLDYRSDDASLKTTSSERKIPLHPALIDEGFITYLQSLRREGSLFPELKTDRFGSKGGIATKRLGPHIRALASRMESLAEKSLNPSHSWRHRMHNEFRRTRERQDVEDRIIGHASEGSGAGYGEYEIIDVLGPAIEQTRSPFDVTA